MSSAAAGPASLFPRPRAGGVEACAITAGSGRRLAESWHSNGPLGLLVRTLLTSTVPHSTKWFLTWRRSVTKSRHRWKFRLVPSDSITGGVASGFSATPTETANQGCPSMQKWSGCRNLEMTPGAWERRMGFPEGWTRVEWPRSGMRSFPKSHNGSQNGSKKRKTRDGKG